MIDSKILKISGIATIIRMKSTEFQIFWIITLSWIKNWPLVNHPRVNSDGGCLTIEIVSAISTIIDGTKWNKKILVYLLKTKLEEFLFVERDGLVKIVFEKW